MRFRPFISREHRGVPTTPPATPYRTPAPPTPSGSASDEAPLPDTDVLVVLIGLWLISVARVAAAIDRAEAFATEATLASMAVVFVPWLLLDTLRAYGRRISTRGPSTPQ